jgi:hypothetical protein
MTECALPLTLVSTQPHNHSGTKHKTENNHSLYSQRLHIYVCIYTSPYCAVLCLKQQTKETKNEKGYSQSALLQSTAISSSPSTVRTSSGINLEIMYPSPSFPPLFPSPIPSSPISSHWLHFNLGFPLLPTFQNKRDPPLSR